jgi:hypothetical protein
LKDLLQTFYVSTGLKVNFTKYMLVPINMDEQVTNSLAHSFGCAVGTLPFTYLGLPLGLTKPKVIDFLPMVKRCESRLACTSALLSQAGRLEVTNAIFSALPMFTMCMFHLHKIVIKQIDKYRKHCLWRSSNINDKKPPKAAWEMVCLPKKGGGLGVLNLKTQNEALLLKNLHKFFNRMDIPWVHLIWESYYSSGSLPSQQRTGSFWWRDNLKLLVSYKGMAMVNVFDGASCLFWEDLWCDRVLLHHMPELYSFARNTGISLKTAIDAQGPESLLHLPLSNIAYQQLLVVANCLSGLPVSTENDVWTYIWGSPFFSSSKVYIHLTGHRIIHPAFKWLWKSACQNKHKVFFWLLLKDRLSTRELLRRRNMFLPSYNCVCCN